MARSRNEYASITTDGESDGEKIVDGLEEDECVSEDACRWCRQHMHQRSKPSMSKTEVLALCAFSILIFSIGAVVARLFIANGKDQCSRTYSTDFALARESVELEEIQFTGAALFDKAGEPFFRVRRERSSIRRNTNHGNGPRLGGADTA